MGTLAVLPDAKFFEGLIDSSRKNPEKLGVGASPSTFSGNYSELHGKVFLLV